MSEHITLTQPSRLRFFAALGAALCALIPFLVIGLSRPPHAYAGGGGADWYVSLSGNNTSCSSWVTACTTVQGGYTKASSGDRIHIAAGSYYEHLTLTKNLTIIGTHPDGGSVTDISGSAPGAVMTINSGYTISLTGVTIRNSQTSSLGGGISNYGILEMSDVLLTGNTATVRGGGIYNYGNATLYNVTIRANTVTESGAGIFNDSPADLTLTNVTLSNNTVSDGYGNGGGIYNLGSMILSSVIISGNTVGYIGGGISNQATASAILDDVTLSGNTAGASIGGGIDNGGDLSLSNVTLDHNQAATIGGGIFNGTNGDAFLMNVTLSDNEAGISGGGIYNLGTMTIINTTIAYNDITSGSNTGGVYDYSPDSGTITMDNSIIAFNENLNCSGTILSDTGRNLNNVAEDYSCDSDEDLIGYDPLLGPLQYNGGKTRTHDLGRGSQAIDNGDNSGYYCAEYDQRGFKRPINGYCDIGAVEYGWMVYLPLVRR